MGVYYLLDFRPAYVLLCVIPCLAKSIFWVCTPRDENGHPDDYEDRTGLLRVLRMMPQPHRMTKSPRTHLKMT